MEAISVNNTTNSMQLNDNSQKSESLKSIKSGIISNDSTKSDNIIHDSDSDVNSKLIIEVDKQVETNGVNEQNSDGTIPSEKLCNSFESNIEMNPNTKESEEDEIKKYVSEISRLKTMLKKKEAQIDTLKKLSAKGSVAKHPKSDNSDSIEESEEDQSEHSVFNPSGKSDSNNRKRGRSKKVVKSHLTPKSRGRPRKFANDDLSSLGEAPEKKSRGRPKKSIGSHPTLFSSDYKKKSRGRPRKSIINDQSSNSINELKETDSEPKEKKSKGRPRKSVADDQSSNSGLDPKREESDSKSDSKDKGSTIDDSEPIESKSAGRPKKSFGFLKRDADKSSGESDIVEKKHRGRPRKNVSGSFENKEKRARGRPKLNSSKHFENTTEENSSTLENAPIKSRGRPKKSKTILDEVADSM